MSATAAFLIIGNEILSGRTQDANLNVLAKKLSGWGVQLKESRKASIEMMSSRSAEIEPREGVYLARPALSSPKFPASDRSKRESGSTDRIGPQL